MLDRFSADHAKRAARRRGAAWLLLGWLAFWLTTAAHPFEFCFTGGPDHRVAATTSISAGPVSFAVCAPEPVPDDNHCPDVSAVTVNATSAAAAKGDRLDAVSPLPSSAVPVAQRDGEMRNPQIYFSPPPPTIPLYRRTQRLLI